MRFNRILKGKTVATRDTVGSLLCEKIDGLLKHAKDEEQRWELLEAILGVARGITDGVNGSTTQDHKKDFDEAYEPLSVGKIRMLLDYRNHALIAGSPELGQSPTGQPSVSIVPPKIIRDQGK